MQDALKRVGSPVSLEAPRAARGVERRVLSRGPSRGRSGCSQRLYRSEGGGECGSVRGQGLRRSGDDKSREVGRSRGLRGSGDDKSRGVGRSRGLLGSGDNMEKVCISVMLMFVANLWQVILPWCGKHVQRRRYHSGSRRLS